MKVVALLAATTFTCLLTIAMAQAHAYLVSSDPANASTIANAPSAITLTFDERLQAKFSTVAVVAPDGAHVENGKPTETDSTVTQQLSALPTQGVYDISYRVISADGHPVSGTISFTYGSAATTTTNPPAPPPPSAPKSSSNDNTTTHIAIAVGIVIVFVAIALIAGRRR